MLFELRLLARDFGQPVAGGSLIDIPLTLADLAALVGASRGASSRALERLRLAGAIERKGTSLVLIDPCVSARATGSG